LRSYEDTKVIRKIKNMVFGYDFFNPDKAA